MKKILIHTNHFYPEVFRVNDLAFDLVKKGYDVTVITGIPDYPQGKAFKGYGLFKKRKEKVRGVNVVRVPVVTRGNGKGLRLIANYLSYLVSAMLTATYLAFKEKYDYILVHETSPVTVGIPAVIVKRIQKIPLLFWCLDLWPESLTAAAGITNRKILNVFSVITKWIYNNSTKILISSKGFEESICQKGDYREKIMYFPNWGEDVFFKKSEKLVDLPNTQGCFKIIYAGNIGEAQNFEAILQAVKLLRDKPIRWLFIGEGRKLNWVKDYVNRNNLQSSVLMMGRYPIEYIPAFFAYADILLVSLKDTYIFNQTVPAKLQAYMASSRPVLAMLNGEGAQIVKESNCGFVVHAGNFEQLSKVITNDVLQCENLEELGRNGYSYYKNNFDKKKIFERFYSLLNCI